MELPVVQSKTPYWCKSAENVPRAWSSSNLSYIADCPRRFQYKYVLGYSPKGEAVALLYGILYHKALEIFDKERLATDNTTALRAAVRFAIAAGKRLDPLDDTARTSRTLTRAVIWYAQQYPNDPAEIVTARNGEPAIEQYFAMHLDLLNPDGEPYLLHGYMDEFRLFAGRRFVWERKTTKGQLTDWYFAQFNPNVQMDIYTLGAKILEHEDFDGVMLDVHQTLVSGSRFKRFPVFRTKTQLEEALADIRSWIKWAEICAERNYWPKNTRACRLCDFQDVCSKSVETRDSFLRGDYTQNRPLHIERRDGENLLGSSGPGDQPSDAEPVRDGGVSGPGLS